MAIVQNKSKRKVETPTVTTAPKGLENNPFLKVNQIKMTTTSTMRRKYKTRVYATNPVKMSDFQKRGVKEKIRFLLPKEHSNDVYKAGHYHVIRLKSPGIVKVFGPNYKELSAKPFILHCLEYVEGLTPDQVVNVKDEYDSTRPLAYRFLRSLKTMMANQMKENV